MSVDDERFHGGDPIFAGWVGSVGLASHFGPHCGPDTAMPRYTCSSAAKVDVGGPDHAEKHSGNTLEHADRRKGGRGRSAR